MEKFYDGDQARLFDEAHIVNPYATQPKSSDGGKFLMMTSAQLWHLSYVYHESSPVIKLLFCSVYICIG